MEVDDITLPPAQDSPKNIMNILNDDCLQAVMSKMELVSDFYRAAQVCTRFQNNAKMCFPFRTIRFGNATTQQDREKVLFHNADRVLKIFGPRIKSIHCWFLGSNILVDHDDFLNLIAGYCRETLTRLEISYGRLIYFRKPFKVLKKLELEACSLLDFDPALIFPELKSLHINSPRCIPPTPDSIQDIGWVAKLFPKLDHAFVRCIGSKNFIEFQNRNPQLKTLRTTVETEQLTSPIWRGIGNRMPNIEALYVFSVSPFEAGMIDIGKLPQIKNLTLFRYKDDDDNDLNITKSVIHNFIKYQQPIETLRIEYVDNELGSMLQNLKTLKILYIQRSSHDIKFEFVNHLSALQYLRIYHQNLYTAKDILKNAKKLSELKIYIGPLANANFDIQVCNSIKALATGRVKVIIFYSTVGRQDELNIKEKHFLSQATKSEWVRFETYNHVGIRFYPNENFDSNIII